MYRNRERNRDIIKEDQIREYKEKIEEKKAKLRELVKSNSKSQINLLDFLKDRYKKPKDRKFIYNYFESRFNFEIREQKLNKNNIETLKIKIKEYNEDCFNRLVVNCNRKSSTESDLLERVGNLLVEIEMEIDIMTGKNRYLPNEYNFENIKEYKKKQEKRSKKGVLLSDVNFCF